MKAKITTASTGTNTLESRDAILQELKSLRDQVYDDGNADYAGRHLFTGYRTSTRLSFEKQDLDGDKEYAYTDIVQKFSKNDMDMITQVTGKLSGTDITNADTTVYSDRSINSKDLYRLRLAYKDVDSASTVKIMTTDANGKPVEKKSYPIKVASLETDGDNCFEPGAGEAILIKETGELILGDTLKNDITDMTNKESISVSYDKKKWETGDIRPEHYFSCSCSVDGKTPVVYAEHDQEINYDISSNQQMQINTNASEVFKHAIGRDIDDLVRTMEEANNADRNILLLEEKLSESGLDETAKANLNKNLTAARKEKAMVYDKLQHQYEHSLATFSGYINDATLTGTKIGTRIERLDLVRNRLMELKTTARELADDNENVELTDIAINVSEAELTYNAALMATGQISQQSLLNYI
jgi:flagellar hook-associated protein 3 FlgL